MIMINEIQYHITIKALDFPSIFYYKEYFKYSNMTLSNKKNHGLFTSMAFLINQCSSYCETYQFTVRHIYLYIYTQLLSLIIIETTVFQKHKLVHNHVIICTCKTRYASGSTSTIIQVVSGNSHVIIDYKCGYIGIIGLSLLHIKTPSH